MESNENFDHIVDRFRNADLDTKIEIYSTVQGLSVAEYKELLKYFPIKHLGLLEKAMA